MHIHLVGVVDIQREAGLMFLWAKKTEEGFSLVELLVVLAIAGTIALIGIPALVSQMSHIRLKRSAMDVATEVNYARVNAITKNTKYRVDFTLSADPTPDTMTIFVFSGGSWGADATRASRDIEDAIDITSPGADFSVYFYPNGISSSADNATASNSAVCLSNTADTNDKMEINVFGTTGRVEIDTGC